MSKKNEVGLIVRKDTKFDKVIRTLRKIFFYDQYFLEERIDSIFKTHKVNTSKIVIPKNIGDGKNERHNFL